MLSGLGAIRMGMRLGMEIWRHHMDIRTAAHRATATTAITRTKQKNRRTKQKNRRTKQKNRTCKNWGKEGKKGNGSEEWLGAATLSYRR
jgi:membrane protease subunit (stomatin/prohibitin family)